MILHIFDFFIGVGLVITIFYIGMVYGRAQAEEQDEEHLCRAIEADIAKREAARSNTKFPVR